MSPVKQIYERNRSFSKYDSKTSMASALLVEQIQVRKNGNYSSAAKLLLNVQCSQVSTKSLDAD